MCVTEETPLPFTNVAFAATVANKFGEAAEAVGGANTAAAASTIANKRARVVRVFIVILLKGIRILNGWCFPESFVLPPRSGN